MSLAAYRRLSNASKDFLNAYAGEPSDRRVWGQWGALTGLEQADVLRMLDTDTIRKGGRVWGACNEGYDHE